MTSKQIKILVNRAYAALSGASNAEERRRTLDDLQAAIDAEVGTPWWVIVLKVLAYAIGLILAGVGTTTACTALVPMFVA